MIKIHLYVIFTILLFSHLASANSNRLEFNGFANLGYMRSDYKEYFDSKIKNEDNFTYISSAGLNAAANISPEWSTTLQLLGKLDKDNFTANFEWVVVKYQPSSNFSFLVGKQKLPAWLISDYFDIGFLYPWPAPPSEIYRFLPLKTFSGGSSEMSFNLPLDLRALLQLYAGIASGDASINATTTLNATAKNMTGAALEIEHKFAKVRVSYSSGFASGSSESYSDTLIAPGVYARTKLVIPFNLGLAKFFSVGTQINYEPFFAMAEYARASSNSSMLKRAAGYYTTVGYKLFEGTLMPYLHFSENTEVEAGLAPGIQRAKAFGLNYLLSSSVKLKAELQTVEVSNGVASFDADPKRPVNIGSLAVSTVF